jgi:hypothetical protein
MRLLTIRLATALLALTGLEAAAEPDASESPYKAPIVASLSAEPSGGAARDERARSLRSTQIGSTGMKLATTAAVFAMAISLASLASRRRD